jgi:DNA polymerase III subunit delta'
VVEETEQPCPWHHEAWQSLARQPRHAHAYLFSGPAGVGKRRFAQAFAALLLCLTPVQGLACGRCRSCLLRHAGSHPDLLQVTPEEEGKAIRVDAIRHLGDFLAQTAQQGGRKVIFLHPAEAMNINASNALLKSLEEPAGDAHLLLITDQPSRLLPTVRSRCLVQKLGSPAQAEALQWLGAQLPDTEAQPLNVLLNMADGAPLKAVELSRQGAADWRALVVSEIKALLKNQTSPPQVADKWSAIPLELLVDWFCGWTLALLKARLQADRPAVGDDMDKVLGYMAERLVLPELLAWQTWLLEHRGKILAKANLNRVLFIESLLIQWKQLVERR